MQSIYHTHYCLMNHDEEMRYGPMNRDETMWYESKKALDIMHADFPSELKNLNASTMVTFVRNVPEATADSAKLTMHMRVLRDEPVVTLPTWYFPKQLLNAELNEIQCVDTDGSLLLKIPTPHGPFWLNVKTDCGGVGLTLRANGAIHTTIPPVEVSLLILTHIDPYMCTNCNVWQNKMRKCKGCWGRLSICVRYCGKGCQREHWQLGHKFICGKRA
jgi:hypothetical protein